MAYLRLSDEIQATVERFVALGISREVVERELRGNEWAFVRDLAEAHHDDQLLLCFKNYGSAACAKRYGVAERTIRDQRDRALSRQSARRTAAG